MAGWGPTEKNGGYSSKLKSIKIPIIPTSDCNNCNMYNGKVTSSMFCAGDEKSSRICEGDFGGPLINGTGEHRSIIGIASWNEGEKDNIYHSHFSI